MCSFLQHFQRLCSLYLSSLWMLSGPTTQVPCSSPPCTSLCDFNEVQSLLAICIMVLDRLIFILTGIEPIFQACGTPSCSYTCSFSRFSVLSCSFYFRENRFHLLQMEMDVHCTSTSSSLEQGLTSCECGCFERGLAAMSVDANCSKASSCCGADHSDRYLLEKANCICNEVLLVKATHMVSPRSLILIFTALVVNLDSVWHWPFFVLVKVQPDSVYGHGN